MILQIFIFSFIAFIITMFMIGLSTKFSDTNEEKFYLYFFLFVIFMGIIVYFFLK